MPNKDFAILMAAAILIAVAGVGLKHMLGLL